MLRTGSSRVLIVEDEPTLADTVRYALEREGFSCRVARDGRSGLEDFRRERPDLVLLDLMLPEISGVDVCRAIRSEGPTPVIIVSARETETDKVLALELGADDYVTKPFGMAELVARVRTVLRRSAPRRTEDPVAVLSAGPVALDVERHEVRVDGSPVSVPPKEFLLLQILLRRRGRLCTRDSLIADVWGQDYFGDTRTLDVHIRRLRHKIEADPRRPRHLLTIRGLGYKFEA